MLEFEGHDALEHVARVPYALMVRTSGETMGGPTHGHSWTIVPSPIPGH